MLSLQCPFAWTDGTRNHTDAVTNQGYADEERGHLPVLNAPDHVASRCVPPRSSNPPLLRVKRPISGVRQFGRKSSCDGPIALTACCSWIRRERLNGA